jgi:uncharacterized protein (TIGR02217 family)
MSNLLFPKIKGLGWSVVINPTFSTDIQQALSAREVRIQNFVNPVWEFTLTYEYLLNDPRTRDENGNTPLETLAGFFLARGGQFDTFLLNLSDLTGRQEDSVYSGQPCLNMTTLNTYFGDGSTASFQLTRNLGGFAEACQNPANQSALVYVGGVAKTQGVDYTISNGVVLFAGPPGAGVPVTADFTFLYRVRFDLGSTRSNSTGASGTREGIEFNNFLFNLYEVKEIQLVSVRT